MPIREQVAAAPAEKLAGLFPGAGRKGLDALAADVELTPGPWKDGSTATYDADDIDEAGDKKGTEERSDRFDVT